METIPKILIIGFVWPEPNSSAAGSRMLQLIAIFREQGYDITFASAAADSDFMADITTLGVHKESIVLNCSSFDRFVQELNPSIVLFDRFMSEEQFGWRVAENCPDALRILDTEDLHCLRLARQKAVKENREFREADLFSDTAKREIASIYRSDCTLMIATEEMTILQQQFKIDSALLYYLPLFAEVDEAAQDAWPDFEERSDFIFIGNFLHEPNWNAVQYLKETIWPLISKELPKAVLKIYGAYPSQKVLQLHAPKQHFLIEGRAADALQVVRNARVMLAPLRFGAGIKGKLLEAMQCGTPSVTTTIGAESMRAGEPWNGSVVDDPKEFAAAAVALYQDGAIWQQAQENGITILKTHNNKALYVPDFITRIKLLQQELKMHRHHNFIGSLLQHHTLNSTKYMARWIEAKNKP
ncbi:glycosyltransferase [Flavobacterium kingsejongi]|uniref:Glycosyltransferase n=1 Tax=Flavobacterium kingsejongi TaxID=1678728 RepID=A0A2S1LPS7_9FLAO|nr:glycosyltransferase [Flavobacterium kingsejongi]AWG25755.1 glycosyltransferase [Flavobacterium kingsejongi]